MPGTPKLSLQDIIDRKPSYSMLTPIAFAESRKQTSGRPRRFIRCICDCGKEHELSITCFTLGHSRSCGCYQKAVQKAYVPTNKSVYPLRLRMLYHGIIDRCYSEKCAGYKNYGGRGVRMCDEWLEDKQAFLKWASENGWRRGLELDKDIKGNGLLYGPDSCMFVTPKENCRNKRNTLKIIYNGEKVALSEVAEIIGIGYHSLYYSISIGLTVEQALERNDRPEWLQLLSYLSQLKIPEFETEEYRGMGELIREKLNYIMSL